jgi:Peptidase A4 family/PASTA domain
MARIRRIIIGSVALAALSLGLSLPAAAATKVRVPDVTPASDAYASAVLKSRHLVPRFVGGDHGAYAQSIRPGTLVNEGTVVTLDTYEEVPDVVGLTLVQATNILDARQFKWTHVGGSNTKVYSENLEPGSFEKIGTHVILTTYELVPSVVGDTVSASEAALRSRSLGYKTSGSGSIVKSESPVAGTAVKLGTVVTLTLESPQLTTGNWAGYAASGSTNDFTSASVSFVVPSVSCADQPAGSYIALWAGLDGFNDETVEQDGIDIYCASADYAPYYFSWYEMYPAYPVVLSLVPVPGDTITAFVEDTGEGYYDGSLSDSDGESTTWTASAPAGALDASAECIVEDPGLPQVPYINLGSASMTGCTVNGKPIGDYSPYALTMENNFGQEAYPSTLSNGDSFTLTVGTPSSVLTQPHGLRPRFMLP